MTKTFKFAVDMYKKFGYIPETPSGYLGGVAYYFQSTYGMPVDWFKEKIEKNTKGWMGYATVELFCLRLLKKYKKI